MAFALVGDDSAALPTQGQWDMKAHEITQRQRTMPDGWNSWAGEKAKTTRTKPSMVGVLPSTQFASPGPSFGESQSAAPWGTTRDLSIQRQFDGAKAKRGKTKNSYPTEIDLVCEK